MGLFGFQSVDGAVVGGAGSSRRLPNPQILEVQLAQFHCLQRVSLKLLMAMEC